MRKEIDLTDPHLGPELLEDPKGDFPLDVWETYCRKAFAHSGVVPWPLLSWRIAPNDPKTVRLIDPQPPVHEVFTWSAALDPQQAVDEAFFSVFQIVRLLTSSQTAQAMKSAERALQTLGRGASWAHPKRGAPASMRPIAVRAWVIHKFNPQLRWRKIADLLFRDKGGKCPRCGFTPHSSPCVKALQEAVRKLTSAMKDHGIPVK
jgi:hypothetical protein